LARALAVEPRVLLLDEPFGALDAKVRQELRQWLRTLHHEIHFTSVFVTHDQDEALEVADRVAVMNHGKIEQIGAPDEVFHYPKTEFVMNFLGNVNTFHGRLEGGKIRFATVEIDSPDHNGSAPAPAAVFIRPHDLEITREPGRDPSFRATVARVHSAGASVRLELTADSGEPLAAVISHERWAMLEIVVGSQVYVTPRVLRIFGEDYGASKRA
jgi:sulfate transport system ATP-binding protein